MSNLKSWSRRVTGNQNLGRTGSRSGRQTQTKREYTGLKMHTYEPGSEQKVVVPLFEQDGVLAPVIVSAPIHKVGSVGALEMKRKDGTTYPIYSVRSNHPFSQGDAEVSRELAERGEVCVFHELHELQRTKMWKDINAKFGEDLTNLPEEQRKEINTEVRKAENAFVVKPTYLAARGDYPARNVTETYILLYVFDTETTIQKNKLGVEKEVQTVLLDDNGQPKYSPVLFSLSAERGLKFETAVNNAIDSELVTEDDLHPYVEFEGTEDERQIFIGWLDFTLRFPNGTKMESGRDMSIVVPVKAQRAVTPELVASLQATEEGKKIVEQAHTFFNNRPNVKVRTRAEQLELMTAPTLKLYNDLREEFAEEVANMKQYFDEKVFAKILAQQESASTTETVTEAPAEEPATESVEAVEAVKPVKPAKKAASTKDVRSLLDKITNP